MEISVVLEMSSYVKWIHYDANLRTIVLGIETNSCVGELW